MLTGASAVMIVPHDQDPGRLYAYSQLWCPAASQALKAQAHSAAHALSAAMHRAKARQTSGSAAGIAAAAIAASTPAAHGSPERMHGTAASQSTKRVSVSLDLAAAAFRFERHPLEQRLALTRAPHARTAAAVAALHGAGGEYEKMRIVAVSRAAAAHRGGGGGSSGERGQQQPQPLSDLLAAGALHAALLRPLLAHDRCEARLEPHAIVLMHGHQCRVHALLIQYKS
jgi:hypothetical protein